MYHFIIFAFLSLMKYLKKLKDFRELAQEGALFSEFAISQVMDQTNIEYILAYTAPLIGNFFA